VSQGGLELVRVADAEAVAATAANRIAELIDAALRERGAAHIALAGGTTPKRAYELLDVPSWEGVELWFGDERCVGPDHPDSNYLMVAQSLLPHAPGAIVHRIEGERGPEAAAAAYETLLRERLPEGVLDVAIQGIGEDGHTASLFPGNPALERSGVLCVPVHDSPKPPPERVSLSLEALLAARHCELLASGAAKADPIAVVLAGTDPAVPASLLRRGQLALIVDLAAAPDG
jgi:6-phosphogluconolactonase